VAHLIHTIDATEGEELEQRLGVQGFPVRQPERDGPQLTRTATTIDSTGAGRAKRRWRTAVHLPYRVVELPDTAKAGREGDLGQAQRRRLDEDPGGLGPLGTGQGQWPGADLGREHPVEVAFCVAE